jgi:hypothetical protein
MDWVRDFCPVCEIQPSIENDTKGLLLMTSILNSGCLKAQRVKSDFLLCMCRAVTHRCSNGIWPFLDAVEYRNSGLYERLGRCTLLCKGLEKLGVRL